jgi:predicted phosphodiesterase
MHGSSGRPGRNWPHKYFAAALEYFKKQNVDAVVHCGDFAHRGQVEEMRFHADVWRRVFPKNLAPDGHKVEKLFVTGNHDTEGAAYGGFVAKNYPDAKIIKIDRDRRDYEVSLSNRLELTFDMKFNLVEIDD